MSSAFAKFESPTSAETEVHKIFNNESSVFRPINIIQPIIIQNVLISNYSFLPNFVKTMPKFNSKKKETKIVVMDGLCTEKENEKEQKEGKEACVHEQCNRILIVHE